MRAIGFLRSSSTAQTEYGDRLPFDVRSPLPSRGMAVPFAHPLAGGLCDRPLLVCRDFILRRFSLLEREVPANDAWDNYPGSGSLGSR